MPSQHIAEPEPDIIAQAERYNQLKSAATTAGIVNKTEPDANQLNQANELRDRFKKEQDVDLEELYNETKDLTPTQYGRKGFSRQELIEAIKSKK